MQHEPCITLCVQVCAYLLPTPVADYWAIRTAII